MWMRLSVIGLAAIAGALCAPAFIVQGQTGDETSAEVASVSARGLTMERLATLEFPWGMAFLPDGRLLITEKPGRLRIWENGRLSEPVQGVPALVYRGTAAEQGGLLDVAVDPDFARDGLV